MSTGEGVAMGSRVEQQLMELREELHEMRTEMRSWWGSGGLPQVLSLRNAAAHLSRSESHVRAMIRAGALATCDLAATPGVKGKKGIPRSEIERIVGQAKAKGPRNAGRKKAVRPIPLRTAAVRTDALERYLEAL